jgi:uncharacterized protein
MDCFALRLDPDGDLRFLLELESQRRELAAGIVLSAVGSLSMARLRFAGRQEIMEIRGDLEILQLGGTLGLDGAHLHMAIADAEGRVFGGHVVQGCIVRTTAEIVCGVVPGVAFFRRLDPRTGFRELVVRPESDVDTRR